MIIFEMGTFLSGIWGKHGATVWRNIPLLHTRRGERTAKPRQRSVDNLRWQILNESRAEFLGFSQTEIRSPNWQGIPYGLAQGFVQTIGQHFFQSLF